MPFSAASSFSSARTWSSSCVDARRHLGRRDLQRAGDAAERALHALHVGQRVVAGHRLDAAHAGGDAAFGDDLEQADVAGALHVRAAAQLAAASRCRARAPRRRTSRRTASSRRSSAPPRSACTRACVAALARISALTMRFDLADLRRRSSARCARSRSACARRSTSEPFCCTCAPSTSRSALCIRWVALWLRTVLARALGVDAGDERVADLDLAFDDAAVVAEHRCLDLLRVLDEHARARVAQLAACRRPGRRSRHRTACGRARRRTSSPARARCTGVPSM